MTPWLRPSLSSDSWLPAHGPGQEITKQGGRQFGHSPNGAGGDENAPPLLCPSSHAEGKQGVAHQGKGGDAHGGGSTCSPGEGAGGQPREWVDLPAPSLCTQKRGRRVEVEVEGRGAGGGGAEGEGACKQGNAHPLHACCTSQTWKERQQQQLGGRGGQWYPHPLAYPDILSWWAFCVYKRGPVPVSSRIVLHLHVLFVCQCGGGGVRREEGANPLAQPPVCVWTRSGQGEVEGGNREGIPFLLFLALLWQWGPKAEGMNQCKQGVGVVSRIGV
ncbi:hypothetical protein V8E53_005537 [Lactarius tabidus]